VEWVIGFAVVFGLAVVTLARRAKKAGPREVDAEALSRGQTVVRCTAAEPGEGWSDLGSKTAADGLRLRFDADDDPQAEAALLVPQHDRAGGNRFGHSRTITLSRDFTDEHVHTSGYVFRLRLRGTGATVGKQVEIKMKVGSNGEPYGGVIENDDDHDPATGDWIDFEYVEIMKVGRGG